MTLARRAGLEISYNNKNITEDIAPHLTDWSYTDNLSNQADDLQISLEDTEQLWSSDWLPDMNARINASIIREYWDEEGKSERVPLGKFEIDEIDISKYPSTATIKALSIPESASLRGQRNNRAWEKVKISKVAADIATKNKLKLFYDTKDDPIHDRIEQVGETDLEFLTRICTSAGLCLKVSNSQIVIFDEEKYEKAEPFTTIKKTDEIKDYKGRMTLTEVYSSCRVEYRSGKKKQTIKYTFTPKNGPQTGKVLVINESVKSIAEAQILAKKKLREKNKEATTVTMIISGDIRFFAGKTVNLADFGKFDGKYIITQSVHRQGSNGYETTINLRKCLEGY